MEYPVFTKECPKGAYELKFEITADMADAAGRMRIGDMARKMEICIKNHFDQVSGITGDELHAQDKTLVITWTYLEIFRCPNIGEQIILRSWPGKDKMMLFSGKFAMYTESGEPLMSTTSLFLLMDLKSRTMAERPVEMNHLDPITVEGELRYPKMTMPFLKEFRNHQRRTVNSEEIDHNGHLNNTHYLDWAENLVDESYYGAHPPKRVWVQYMKEMKEGETAHLQYDWMNSTLLVKGTVHGEDTFFFMMDL